MENILERYKSFHNLTKDKEVAERMGLTESALSNQKKRGSLNYGGLIESCDPEINLHWLLTGDGEPFLSSSDSDLESKFSDYEASLDDLDKSDITTGDFLDFVLKQQEAVLTFLHNLKSKRSDD